MTIKDDCQTAVLHIYCSYTYSQVYLHLHFFFAISLFPWLPLLCVGEMCGLAKFPLCAFFPHHSISTAFLQFHTVFQLMLLFDCYYPPPQASALFQAALRQNKIYQDYSTKTFYFALSKKKENTGAHRIIFSFNVQTH